MNMFKKWFRLLIINKSEKTLFLPSYQQVATATPRFPCKLHTNFSDPSPYTPDSPLTSPIHIIHYKQRFNRLQQIQEHSQVARNENRFKKEWHDEVTIFDNYKQHKETLIEMLSELLDL